MLYKGTIFTLVTMDIVGMFISIVVWGQEAVFTHIYIYYDVDDWDRWFLGRAPRTRETLPDFLGLCRVTRYSRVFCGLTSCQRTPRFWGVTPTPNQNYCYY